MKRKRCPGARFAHTLQRLTANLREMRAGIREVLEDEILGKKTTIDKTERVYDFAITDHELVPRHEVLTEEEKKEVLERYHISAMDLPKIYITDPVIQRLIIEGEEIKLGDVVKITRHSPTAKKFVAYRLVVEQG